jgi:hypothetical protein
LGKMRGWRRAAVQLRELWEEDKKPKGGGSFGLFGWRAGGWREGRRTVWLFWEGGGPAEREKENQCQGGEKENGEALVGCVLVCEGDNNGEGKETVEPAGSAKWRPPGGLCAEKIKFSSGWRRLGVKEIGLGFLFPFFICQNCPPSLKIQCSMVFIGKVLLGFQTSPSTFPFLLFSFFFW